MAYARFNIALKRIREVVEQSAGTLRPVPAGRFGGELPEGLNDESAMAKAASVPRVESSITSIEPSSSSPPVLGDLRIYEVQVTVKVVRVLSALEQVSDADRDELHALAAQDADVLSQALGFPGNLSRTAAGVETEIVSGLLVYRSSSVLVKKPTDDGAQPVITSHVFRGHMISRPSQEVPFVFTIRTNKGRVGFFPATGSNEFRFYGVGTYDIDWGDGSISFGVSGTQTKTYASVGTYVIKVSNWTGGEIRINPPTTTTTDIIKISTLIQWGSVQWTSCVNMFLHAAFDAVVAADAPNLSRPGISLAGMFENSNFNGSLFASMETWDTSQVSSMYRMFYSNTVFNQPIGSWNTSNLKNTSLMFYLCSSFNQPIGAWDVSGVTDMGGVQAGFGGMFQFATAFNQDISAWNVQSVTSMNSLFRNATAFNQNLSAWAVNSVTNMNSMFDGATAFNQDLGAWVLNDNVTMTSMLNTTSTTQGMSAENYSRTLIGWSNERKTSGTPINRSLGANNRRYNATVYGGAPFDNAVSARADLVLATGSGGGGWTITGDALI